MSKVTVLGNALVISSALKLEDIRTLEKYAPEALQLKNEDKEVVFAVGAGKSGDVSKYGVTFADELPDGSGLAAITMTHSYKADDNIPSKVADLFGQALANLNRVEAQAPAALDDVAARKAAIMENVVIA